MLYNEFHEIQDFRSRCIQFITISIYWSGLITFYVAKKENLMTEFFKPKIKTNNSLASQKKTIF